MKKKRIRDKSLIKKRTMIALGGLTVLISLLTARLGYIMIVKHEEYAALANEQWPSEVSIAARRGDILDRNGTELAVSANVYRVDFDLNSIRSYLKKTEKYNTMEDIAPLIASALDMDESTVLDKLNTKLPSGKAAGSATLVRRIEKEPADKVKELNITGVIVSSDTKRYYLNDNLLAHALGTTNIDGQGLTGVELQYNKELSGVPGVKITEIDNAASELPYTVSEFTKPVDGKDVYLTIDEKIQFFAESIAEQAYKDHEAEAVSILVMDPKTGEILAMVNKPDFNPNNPQEGIENYSGDTPGDQLQKMWRNRLVNDTFEPGSIFKVVTAITALEENLVTDDLTFNCTGGLHFGSNYIKCWRTEGHGVQHFGDIIQNSCNVGFMELGDKIGKETLYEYIKKFGFGELSGIDLPGEAAGIVKKPENISVTDLATIAFGQTNTVNSVQYMAAFNAVANGGTWIQPHIMKEIAHEDESGNVIVDESFEPETRTVASKENTAELREYLERVVTSGSATGTFLEGYRIGGKTGTAQKVVNGVYQSGKYISSFVGMAPVDDPKVTVMITVDEPSTGIYYAGQVCVPYAKTLFTDIFNYLDSKFTEENENSIVKNVVIPEVRGLKLEEAKKALTDLKLNVEVNGNGSYVVSLSPYPGYTVKEGATITINTTGTSSTEVIMPSVKGYDINDARKLLDSLGIKYAETGEGVVTDQSIPQGELIQRGSTVTLTLSQDYKD